jgi:hypothetical protein
MSSTGLLRDPEAERSDRVGFIELFFDLVFVFAVTQLAHRLVELPSPRGVAESLVLFLAIWSVWTGTAWVTNRLDVERNLVRLLLLAMMIGGLFQALAIPDAFSFELDARGFALCTSRFSSAGRCLSWRPFMVGTGFTSGMLCARFCGCLRRRRFGSPELWARMRSGWFGGPRRWWWNMAPPLRATGCLASARPKQLTGMWRPTTLPNDVACSSSSRWAN